MNNLLYATDDELMAIGARAFRLGVDHGRVRAGEPDGTHVVIRTLTTGGTMLRPYHRRELHKVYLAGFSIGHHNEVTIAREGKKCPA
jgi:hypothetical protein